MHSLLLMFLVGCDAPPASCDRMCASASMVYADCIEGWGVEWSDAGYADADDFTETCLTWAWEMNLLQAEAGVDELDAVCQERNTILAAEEAVCEDYQQMEWNDVPW